jgi:hypothetical protein
MSNTIDEHDNNKKDDGYSTSSESEYANIEYSESEDDYTDSDYSESEDDYTDSDYSEIDVDIYVITIDDKPYFYELSLTDAKNKILDVSKKINKKINENELYDSYICHKKDDEITISNQLDFIFFTKTYVLHTLKIHKLRKN